MGLGSASWIDFRELHSDAVGEKEDDTTGQPGRQQGQAVRQQGQAVGQKGQAVGQQGQAVGQQGQAVGQKGQGGNTEVQIVSL